MIGCGGAAVGADGAGVIDGAVVEVGVVGTPEAAASKALLRGDPTEGAPDRLTGVGGASTPVVIHSTR